MTEEFGHADHDGPHPDDPVKRSEHMAAINLVNPETAVIATGTSSGLRFNPNDDLYVPAGAEFLIDGDLDVGRIRFDGTLRVTTDPCMIRVETIVGNTTGKLSVPESASLRTIRIKARGPRDRAGDPTDISGGIILHSKDNVLSGEPKTSVAVPTSINMRTLRFSSPVENWTFGDALLVPGITSSMADDIVTVDSVSSDGLEVVISPPALQVSRKLPDGTFPAVGNLTRSLVIESESTELSQRGHVMVMHEHTGTNISHVAFVNLGRTSVEARPTKITLGPDGEFVSGDGNTIGRYALHAHGRSGAHTDVPPHQWVGNVIEDAPSHGLVNHGSNVSARENVVYNCGGSNLFGENGLELGDFTGNLCVLSRGRQETTTLAQKNAETAALNFGWEGTTIWLQGPGIDVVGNHCYRAKFALIQSHFKPLPDAGGSDFDYPVAYLREGPHKDAVLAGRFPSSAGKTKIGFHQAVSYFNGNVGAGAPFGQVMTLSQFDTRSTGDGLIQTKIYEERSNLLNSRFYNVDAGLGGTYVGHIDVRNCKFYGNLKLSAFFRPYHGTFDGTKIHDVSYIDCEFHRFQVGFIDRAWSDVDLIRCKFSDNLIDLHVSTHVLAGQKTNHVVWIEDCEHLGRPAMAAVYASKNPNAVYGKPHDFWFVDQYAQRNRTYSIEPLLPSRHTIDGRMLYYPDNADDFVLYSGVVGTGSQFNDLNNAQLWAQHGVAVSGRRFDPADPQMELLTIDSNIPVYVQKLTPPPEPRTVEQRLDAIEERLDAIEAKVGR